MSQTTSQRVQSWFIPIGIVVIAGLLITLIVLQLRGSSDPSAESTGADEAQAEDPDLTFVETCDSDDVQTAGPVDAPVALVVYSDYQCTFCARWPHDIFPEIMEYAEIGDLLINYSDD